MAELNERMSGYELLRWQLLETIDPWGPKRADYQAAVIAWVIASVFGGKKRPKLRDFIKMFDFADKYEQTDEEVSQIFEAMAGGK